MGISNLRLRLYGGLFARAVRAVLAITAKIKGIAQIDTGTCHDVLQGCQGVVWTENRQKTRRIDPSPGHLAAQEEQPRMPCICIIQGQGQYEDTLPVKGGVCRGWSFFRLASGSLSCGFNGDGLHPATPCSDLYMPARTNERRPGLAGRGGEGTADPCRRLSCVGEAERVLCEWKKARNEGQSPTLRGGRIPGSDWDIAGQGYLAKRSGESSDGE